MDEDGIRNEAELWELMDECTVGCAMAGHGQIFGNKERLEPRLHGRLKWEMMRRFRAETGKSWSQVKAKKP